MCIRDRGKGARVKQEHNISNNKMLLYDAANLAAFLYRLKNFFKQNYAEIVETIRLVAPYFDDFVLEHKEGNEAQIVPVSYTHLDVYKRQGYDYVRTDQHHDGDQDHIPDPAAS